MNGFRDNKDKLTCTICDKEIIAGKRCIECFISKKTKRPEVSKVVGVPVDGRHLKSTEPPLSIPNSCIPVIPNNNGWPFIGEETHAIISTNTTANDGTIIKTYKVNYPRFDGSVDQYS